MIKTPEGLNLSVTRQRIGRGGRLVIDQVEPIMGEPLQPMQRFGARDASAQQQPWPQMPSAPVLQVRGTGGPHRLCLRLARKQAAQSCLS